jgi:hypothetical protein
MRTVEDRADPICQLLSRQQPLGLYDLALAMDPLGLQEAGGYGAHGPPIHEAHPHLPESGHKQPVAGDGLRSFAGIILGDRLFDEAQGLSCIAPTAQSRSGQATPPGLVQETYHPLRATFGQADQPLAPPFFSHTADLGN